jgi:probable phosphoglycerate mutase
MSRSVTLVRHGQTESSKRMIYSGRRDIPLTDQGREQACRVARQLAGTGVDAVYTSPLSRARDTAELIAAAAAAPLIVEPRLIEVDYGAFEGLDRPGARAKLGRAFADWRADPFGATIPGSEPLAVALERARAATADALAAHDHPVLVAHQGILRIVLIALGDLAPQDYFTRGLREGEPVVIEQPAVVPA